MITAILAFYLGAAEIINEAHGKTVLPIGAAEPKPAVPVGGLRA
jgi:succinate-acetate transporter protein